MRITLALLLGCGVVQAQNAPANPTQTWTVPDGTDSVVVGFSNSPARAPVVTGPLWNGSQPAPATTNGSPRAAILPVHKRGLKPQVLAEPTSGRNPDGGRG